MPTRKTFSSVFILHGVMSKSGKHRKMKLVILREKISPVGEQLEEEEAEIAQMKQNQGHNTDKSW